MDIKDILDKISNYEVVFKELRVIADIDVLEAKYSKYNSQISENDFWDNSTNAKKILKKFNIIKEKLDDYNNIYSCLNELKEYLELYELDSSDDIKNEIISLFEELKTKYELYNTSLLLDEEYDSFDCILEVKPGAGGVDSQDWAEILLKMYRKYFEKKNFSIFSIELDFAEVAGIRSGRVIVKGSNAYGLLKGEHGIQRLVRLSPFDSNKRRHTSFASVEVTPLIDDDIEVIIKDSDLKVDTFRSSGAGGQSVNTTDSAVRIKHIPTNIVITCQDERSQLLNKDKALKLLKSKIFKLESEKRDIENSKLRGEKLDNSFGSQIRSYVFHPYTLVKDHRTKIEDSNMNSVLDGNIDLFISGYLKYYKRSI